MSNQETPHSGGRTAPGTTADRAAVSVPTAVFERLATIAADHERSPNARIGGILQLIADGLDLGLAFLARVDGDILRIERAYDRAAMGLHEGTALPLRDTYCQVILAEEADSLVVEDAHAAPRFADLATTRALGIGAYSGVPLHRADGTLYGTLCTLHPRARALRDGEVGLLRLAGRLVMQAIEAVELREREARFRALTAHGTDLVRILAPDGAARYGSTSYTRVLGAPLEELHHLAGSPLGVIHPDDRARVQATMIVCARDGLSAATLTCRHRHADGSWRTLECVATNRLADPAVGGAVTGRDVTAHVQAEERLRALTEAAADAIIAADADGRILSWNAAATHLFGYAKEEVVGRPLTLLMPESYRAAHAQGLRRLAAGGEPRALGHTLGLVGRRKDGGSSPSNCPSRPGPRLRAASTAASSATSRRASRPRRRCVLARSATGRCRSTPRSAWPWSIPTGAGCASTPPCAPSSATARTSYWNTPSRTSRIPMT